MGRYKGVISRVTIAITHIRGLIAPPPSGGLYLSTAGARYESQLSQRLGQTTLGLGLGVLRFRG